MHLSADLREDQSHGVDRYGHTAASPEERGGREPSCGAGDH